MNRSERPPLILIAAAIALGMLLPLGCRDTRNHDQGSTLLNMHPDTLLDHFDYANKALIDHEDDKIDQYVTRHQLNLIKTPTGLRYRIFTQGNGPLAVPGNFVVFNYRLRLINGIVISDSDADGPMQTVIEQAEMVSGLHELLQYMNKGAKARAIIPFRLAYGFTGDQERIPKGATLVYDVEILDIK